MKDNNNENIPSLERRLLTKLQRKHLDELTEEAKKLEKKAFRKRDAYFTAEKSYQRFNEKYLGVIPQQAEKKNRSFCTFTTQFAQNVATLVVVVSLVLAGTLSTQAIYNGGRVEIDNGKDSIETLYMDECMSDVSYGEIEDYQKYDALEEVEQLKGQDVLCLEGQITDILYWKQSKTNSDNMIETYKINYLCENQLVWITMRVNDVYELKEEIVDFESYEELFILLNLNNMYHQDGISNISFVFDGISYDIAIAGTDNQLEAILQLLEIKEL